MKHLDKFKKQIDSLNLKEGKTVYPLFYVVQRPDEVEVKRVHYDIETKELLTSLDHLEYIEMTGIHNALPRLLEA